MKLVRFFVFFFIVISPFSAWLAVSSWLRFPVVVILLCTVVASPVWIKALVKAPALVYKDREDILFLFFLVFVWLAYGFGFGNQRSFNHALSYTFSITVYFILFKVIIEKAAITLEQLAKYVMVAVVVCNSITCIDWFFYNVVGIGIRPFFLTGPKETYNMMYYYQTFFYSVAGVGEEPGGTASLVNPYFPIGLWYIKTYTQKKGWVPVYILLHAAAAVFLASAAGVVFMLIGLAMVSLYKLNFLITYFKQIFLFGLVLAALLYFPVVSNFADKYVDYVVEKVSLSDKNYSSVDRQTKWQYALEDWLDSPWFGHGPGYGTEGHSTGYFNTFLQVLADTGIFSFILINAFFVILLFKIHSLQSNDRYFLLFSVIILLLHSSVYYVYYHGPFWIPLIIAQLLYRQKLNKLSKSPELL